MAESSLFAASPHQPIDVMLLVENSHQMSSIWDDLRNRYLSILMSRLQVATSEPITASVTVWVLESQSTTGSPRSYTDPYEAINDVRLSYEEENRVSSAKVDEAAIFLQALRAEDQSRSLHLIVVAASTPLDATDVSPWYGLADKLVQANIHCHLLMRTTSEDMTALTTLFEETLRSQSNLEDLVSFPVDAEFAVRLSMSPAPGQFNPRPQRIPMPPRRNTFPLEAGSHFDHEQQQQYHLQLQQQQLVQQQQLLAQQSAQPPDGSPSLVSHLQQVHGLTKKKVYGAKPVRKPFFKDEPYYDRPEQPPPQHAAPLKAPAYSHDGTLPPSSGRAMTHSKADRLARLAHTNPTDPQGRQYGTTAWARRVGGSRLASPELSDATLPTGSFSDLSSPPTSYLSSNLSSPVSPVSMDYGASVVNGGSPDPTWLQPAYAASGPAYAAGIPQPPHSAPPTQQAYYVPPPPGPPVHGMYPPEYVPMQVPQGMPGPGMVVRSNVSPPNAAMSPPPTIPPPPGAVTATSGKTITPPPRSGASSVSSIPGTTAATSTTTTPRSAKKQKPNRPEDDEYIELDPAFVQNQTNLFNEMFPNAEKDLEEKVKAAAEASSGNGVGKVGVSAAGVGGGAGVSGTGSSTSKSPASASLTKPAGRPSSRSTTTSSPASTSSSKVAGGSKSPSTAASSAKSKTRASKTGSISKKAKRSGATTSPSTPPSTVANAATSARTTPNTSSAPIPTSLPVASTSAASTAPVPPSGLSTTMTMTPATMGSSDSGFSGSATGVALGAGVPVATGGVQESAGSQVYGIGLVGAVLDATMAKPRVAVSRAIVQGTHTAGHIAAAELQPLMYATPPQGTPGSALGYTGAPPQGGVQAGLQSHYPHQYQQHPAQIQMHQLHQPTYLHSAAPSQLQSPVSSPVLDNAGRYQHMSMPPPSHPSTHQMGVALAQYDDGSEVPGYYSATHYAASLGEGGPPTPNSLAGWAGSV